jgi:hypothetical protein
LDYTPIDYVKKGDDKGMRKGPVFTRIVIHFTNPSELPPVERAAWQERWDRFWRNLLVEAKKQIEEDKKKGIKYVHTTKKERIEHIGELAEQLGIEVPKVISRLLHFDIWTIEHEMEHELYLKQQEKDGCQIIYEPPRMAISEIISRKIKNAKLHKSVN